MAKMMGSVVALTISSCVMMMMMAVGGVDAATVDPQSTQYVMLSTTASKDRARCIANNKCYLKKLKCPSQCPKRISSVATKPSCFIDCSAKCQTTCKKRKPKCNGYSSVCYDPRFVGGDGVMFYFHGKSNEDFCLVSDTNLHVNAHFIGARPQGRTRDFTWVQALGIMFDDHTFSIAAEKIATWTDDDHLLFTFDGQVVDLAVGAGSKWTSEMGEVEIQRISETNTVQVTIDGGSMVITVEAVPITKEEDLVHRYELPADNCFAHLNVQFDQFRGLSDNVDGVLGQTYRPGFKNPVKVGVPMPIMGGESQFKTSSLFSTDCLASKFHQNVDTSSSAMQLSSVDFGGSCTASSTDGGIVCRR